MNRIITIDRQYGSGGHEIGEALAKELGWSFYDNKLIDLAVKKSGMHVAVVYEADEKASNPWLYAMMGQAEKAAFGMTVPTNDEIFAVQAQIMKDIAKTENAVIVGRCSDYVLEKEDADLLSVFVYAPIESRVKRIMEQEELSEQQALQVIKRNDKRRKYYYDFYTDRKWAAHENYHMTLNSERFGIGGAVKAIIGAMGGK